MSHDDVNKYSYHCEGTMQPRIPKDCKYFNNSLQTKSMKPSPCESNNSHSASQEIPRLLRYITMLTRRRLWSVSGAI
jgi:hypothetical protein